MNIIFNFVFLLSFLPFMGVKSAERLKIDEADLRKPPKDGVELATENKR